MDEFDLIVKPYKQGLKDLLSECNGKVMTYESCRAFEDLFDEMAKTFNITLTTVVEMIKLKGENSDIDLKSFIKKQLKSGSLQ